MSTHRHFGSFANQKREAERNDRIFVVPERSPFEADLTDIRRLPKRAIEELERFFEATDELQLQDQIPGLGGPSKAVKAVKKYAK